ncbi:hypothetical protein [Streptomyces echinatus]|uniref:hypothetical protein n=1 Tax=Streptomyces echinatus TaxID=67293 RepID=UPI003795E28F
MGRRSARMGPAAAWATKILHHLSTVHRTGISGQYRKPIFQSLATGRTSAPAQGREHGRGTGRGHRHRLDSRQFTDDHARC